MGLFHGGLLGSALWIAVAAGWLLVLLIGLEPDKPLSGELPGRGAQHAAHPVRSWRGADWLGEVTAWALLGGASLLMLAALYWVLSARGTWS